MKWRYQIISKTDLFIQSLFNIMLIPSSGSPVYWNGEKNPEGTHFECHGSFCVRGAFCNAIWFSCSLYTFMIWLCKCSTWITQLRIKSQQNNEWKTPCYALFKRHKKNRTIKNLKSWTYRRLGFSNHFIFL